MSGVIKATKVIEVKIGVSRIECDIAKSSYNPHIPAGQKVLNPDEIYHKIASALSTEYLARLDILGKTDADYWLMQVVQDKVTPEKLTHNKYIGQLMRYISGVALCLYKRGIEDNGK